MGPKLEKGMAPWLWVGGEDGRLLGLDEWGDWLAGVEWSANQSTVSISHTFRLHEWILITSLWRTWAGGERRGPRGAFKQRVEGRLLVHHGSVGLGAGRQVFTVSLTEDAVLVVLLHTNTSCRQPRIYPYYEWRFQWHHLLLTSWANHEYSNVHIYHPWTDAVIYCLQTLCVCSSLWSYLPLSVI